MVRSQVTGNRLSVSPGGERQGGGIYNAETLELGKTRVSGNRPDQCFGC
jgi:hypothetical protein